MQADQAEVSPALLGAFVGALMEWRARTHHAVVQALSDGFIAVCLVLTERAGIGVHWPESRAGEVKGVHDVKGTSPAASSGGWQTRLHEQAAVLAGLMPR